MFKNKEMFELLFLNDHFPEQLTSLVMIETPRGNRVQQSIRRDYENCTRLYLTFKVLVKCISLPVLPDLALTNRSLKIHNVYFLVQILYDWFYTN